MIDSYKALGWLNAIDRKSRLSREVRRLIGEIRRFPLDDVRVSLILERLRNIAQAASDPLEKAEILTCCASIGAYQCTWSPPAARDAREAVILYDCDDHRRAVALWILGIIQWEMFQNHQAHRNWLEAKQLFEKYRILFKDFPDEKAWYTNRRWEMDIELLARPEEIASWLNCFEGPSLRPETQEIIRKVRKKTRQQAYSNIHALMEDLQQANQYSGGFHETAEIQLEFGLAVYQLRNSYAAIEFLRKAVRNFYPAVGEYHKQVVARCMLGALEWMQQSTARQAFEDWDCCLDEFENLRWDAARDNDDRKEKWYRYQRTVLRAALVERVRPADPSETG